MMLATFIIVYIICALYMRRWIRIAYSENGRWYGLESDIVDVLASLFPVVNIAFTISCILDSPYDSSYKNKNYNKFFGIKNK